MPDNLKSNHAKEKHGDLMLKVAQAAFIGVFSALIGPVTLRLFDASPQPIPSEYVMVLAIVVIGASYLMLHGLRKIDEARVQPEFSIASCTRPIEKLTDKVDGLNLSINHGQTQIIIQVKNEKEASA